MRARDSPKPSNLTREPLEDPKKAPAENRLKEEMEAALEAIWVDGLSLKGRDGLGNDGRR